MLIKGKDLSVAQRELVLRAFVHRWTHENAKQTYAGKCPACVQHRQCDGDSHIKHPKTGEIVSWHEYHVPLTTDAEWIKGHAFHFNRDGRELSSKENYAEPAYIADAVVS